MQDGPFADVLRSVALGWGGEGEPRKQRCAAWKKVLSAGQNQPCLGMCSRASTLSLEVTSISHHEWDWTTVWCRKVMRFKGGSFMPFVTNSIFFSCFFTPVMFVFLKAGTGSGVTSGSRGRLPFLWGATEHIQGEDLRPGQGTEDREHSPGGGTAWAQRSRNYRAVGRRQPGSGLPRDPLGEAQLAAAQKVTDLQPSLEIR